VESRIPFSDLVGGARGEAGISGSVSPVLGKRLALRYTHKEDSANHNGNCNEKVTKQMVNKQSKKLLIPGVDHFTLRRTYAITHAVTRDFNSPLHNRLTRVVFRVT